MLSVLNLMILRLDVVSLEDFADLGSAGANPADHSMIFPKKTTSPCDRGTRRLVGKKHFLKSGVMVSCALH